jgi:hypothetical protein
VSGPVPLADLPLLLAVRVASASATVSPEPAEVVDTPEPELVTPGTIGFLVTFGVAVALVFLIRDMVRRVRHVEFESERREAAMRAELEAAGTADGEPEGRPGGDVTPGEGRDGDGERPAGPNG